MSAFRCTLDVAGGIAEGRMMTQPGNSNLQPHPGNTGNPASLGASKDSAFADDLSRHEGQFRICGRLPLRIIRWSG